MENRTLMSSKYASIWMRSKAFGFDYILIAAYIVFVTIISFMLTELSPVIQQSLFSSPIVAQLTSFCIITLPVTLYFVFYESSVYQGTWGKHKIGLKVVHKDEYSPNKKVTLYRNILKFLPWELAHTCIWQINFSQEMTSLTAIGLVTVWIIVGGNFISLWLTPKRQSIYDLLTNTQVITSTT